MGRRNDGRVVATVSRTSADVLEGLDDLSCWDDEEIRRGQRRSKRGNFVGRPPKLVPQRLHEERHRRTLTKAHQLFTENTVTAVEVLVDIATDLSAPHADRIKAASLILDRVLGKSPQAIEVAMQEPPYLKALAASIVSSDTDPDDDIIEAEIVAG